MSKFSRAAAVAPSTSAPPALSDLPLADALRRIARMSIVELRPFWRETYGKPAPEALTKDLMARALAYRLQEQQIGGLGSSLEKHLAALSRGGKPPRRRLKLGSVLVRKHGGELHEVFVTAEGYCWRGETLSSLSMIAKRITGVSWSGPRFFGLRGSDAGTETDGKRGRPAAVPSLDGAKRSADASGRRAALHASSSLVANARSVVKDSNTSDHRRSLPSEEAAAR